MAILTRSRNLVSSALISTSVRATFTEPSVVVDRPRSRGLFIGGVGMTGATPSLLACTAYADGSFEVTTVAHGQVEAIQPRRPHPAMHRTVASGTVTQGIAWTVTVTATLRSCAINGQTVATLKRDRLIGPGRLSEFGSAFGVRVDDDAAVDVSGPTPAPVSEIRETTMKTIIWSLLLALAPAVASAQTKVEYYHVDAIGSVRAVTDNSGAVVRRHDYAPFGEDLATVVAADPLRFVGKERDAENGLDYSMARFYSAKWGRFTTVDPGHVGGDIFDPQSWNAYAYSRNNPLRFVDPLGTDYIVALDGYDPVRLENPDFFRLQSDPGAGFRFIGNFVQQQRNGKWVTIGSVCDEFCVMLSDIARTTRPIAVFAEKAALVANVAFAFTNPVASTIANCVGYGCDRQDLAMAVVPHLRVTRMMHSTARIIAEGRRIHKVDQLVAKFGGQANKWVKMSAVDAAGREIHWYQHPGIGKVGIKLAGQPDPF